MADDQRPPARHRVSHDPGRAHTSARQLYNRTRRRWSDVQAHLPRFVEAVMAREHPTVVELGSRGGVSTAAWLYGIEEVGGVLYTVDLMPAPVIAVSVPWVHVQGDDLSAEVLDRVPTEIDILFIDTSHEMLHTFAELETYFPRVRPGGVVFLHDTALEHPDGVPVEPAFPVRTAVERFTMSWGLPWVEHPGSYGLGEIRAF